MTTITHLVLNSQIIIVMSSALLVLGVFYGMGIRAHDLGLHLLSRGAVRTRAQEKRREPRAKCNLLVEILDPYHRTFGMGRLLNLSVKGALLSTATELRPGDSVQARLPTQPSGTNHLVGFVVWTQRTTGNTLYGLQFNHS